MSEAELLDRIKNKLESTFGSINVCVTAGSSEYGVDVVFLRKREFDEEVVTGLQLKVEPSMGSGTAQKAIGQAVVALGHRFTVGGHEDKPLDLVYIVNHGYFTPQALEYLQSARRKLNCLIWLDKDRVAPYVADAPTSAELLNEGLNNV